MGYLSPTRLASLLLRSATKVDSQGEASIATSTLHPTNQRSWFHAPHESAGRSCRLSAYQAL